MKIWGLRTLSQRVSRASLRASRSTFWAGSETHSEHNWPPGRNTSLAGSELGIVESLGSHRRPWSWASAGDTYAIVRHAFGAGNITSLAVLIVDLTLRVRTASRGA